LDHVLDRDNNRLPPNEVVLENLFAVLDIRPVPLQVSVTNKRSDVENVLLTASIRLLDSLPVPERIELCDIEPVRLMLRVLDKGLDRVTFSVEANRWLVAHVLEVEKRRVPAKITDAE
jgi:hypothetical protein